MMDSIRRGATNLLSGFYAGDSIGRADQLRLATVAGTAAKPAELYALLRAYYGGNGLYQNLARGMHDAGVANPAMRGLRNPAFRVVEFYVAALWPGQLPDCLPIETDNDRIVEPIHQVWTWSNWGSQKQVAARWLPMLGDLFIKVCQNTAKDRVYFQLIDPAHVVDFDTDERGYLTYVRIDVPITRRSRDATRSLTHTEVWSRDLGTFRRWEHDQGDRPVEELGAPLEETPLTDFGIDFVPIVHCQFRDVGEARGVGAFTLALDKIDEAARKATRLGQQLFRSNNATWVVESAGRDASGRPLPALSVGTDGATTGARVVVGDETMYSLPGGYTLTSLVPNIDFAASLAALNADLLELQADLPEMSYWRIPEAGGNLSGRALRTLLAPALTRVEEARGNAHAALVRADQMALTMAAHARLPGFTGIGDYAAGEFDHAFTGQDVIPADAFEEAQTAVQVWTAAKMQADLGIPLSRVLEERGYQPDEIASIEQGREADQGALDDALGAILDRQPGAVVGVQPGQPAPPNGNGARPPAANGR